MSFGEMFLQKYKMDIWEGVLTCLTHQHELGGFGFYRGSTLGIEYLGI